MDDAKTAIMNAAERRMQLGGFNGFSFREIAADIGIKSSSVHYHFPTKEDLAAAVIRRWSGRTSKNIDAALEKDADSARVSDKGIPGNRHIRRTYMPLHSAGRRLPGPAAGSRDGSEEIL